MTMQTAGTVTSPIGHTRGIPLPGTVRHRPIERRNTSPFTSTAPAKPDPDAIARLERLGLLVITEEVVDEKPVKVVRKRRLKRTRTNRRTSATRALRRPDLEPAALGAEYEAGATLAQLAQRHNAAVETIRGRLLQGGIQLRDRSAEAEALTDRMVELAAEGLNHAQIGARIGLSEITVGKRLRDRGIRSERLRVPFDEDLAICMARSGASANAVALAVGVARRTVIDRLKQRGITFGNGNQRADTEAILTLARQGLYRAAIARELDLSERTVRLHLRGAGVEPADGRGLVARTRRPDISAEALAADYRAGMTVPQLAEKYDAALATIRRRLASVEGLEWRDDRAGHSGGGNRTTPDLEDAIVRAYQGGAHAGEISLQYSVPASTVLNVLDRHGIERRTAGESQRGRTGQDGAFGLKELMRSNGITAADVRDWATSTGRDIPARGLPSRHLVETYLLENRTAGKESA